MLHTYGGLQAARILLHRGKVSDGYAALFLRGRLDLTVEALIYDHPKWHPLFTKEELLICSERLQAYGYPGKGRHMNISIFARKGVRPQIQPDPARVALGERVTWQLYYDGREEGFAEPILWSITFKGGSPFNGSNELSVETKSNTPEHKGALDAGPTGTPGDHKYDVVVSSAVSHEVLGEDDPWLIVAPR
jgi:hypothetical protein